MSASNMRISVATAIIIGLFAIFAFSFFMNLISSIVGTEKTTVAKFQPQVQWTQTWFSDLLLVFNWLATVLTNPYADAVLIAAGIVLIAFEYVWFRQE
jgi:ABC-type transport system involved in multi-copper enzyme maturation permease subunit